MLMTKKRCAFSLLMVCGSFVFVLIWIFCPHQDMSTWEPLLLEFNYSCCHNPEHIIQEDMMISDFPRKKWLIISSPGPPTVSNLKICKVHGWQKIVIGEDAYSSIWSENGCLYQSNYSLKKTKFKSAKYLQYYKDFAFRKNVAMLSAVSEQVDVIVDLEADDLDSFMELRLHRHWFLTYDQARIFNPFSHFSYSVNEMLKIPYTIRSNIHPQIQAIMPDVNYVRDHNSETHSHKFDSQAPIIATIKGTLVDLIPKTRVYWRNSMWAMFSFSAASNSNHLCHHQLQQRLLWEILGYYVIHPSKRENFSSEILHRSPSKESCDQILMSTKCTSNTSLLDCCRQIIERLVVHGFLDEMHREIFETWIRDLLEINYDFPSRKVSDNDSDSQSISVDYMPKVETTYSYIHAKRVFLNSSCYSQLDSQTTTPKVIEDILLLIVFNLPIYKYVTWLHNIYSLKFRTIAYCGDKKNKFDKETGSLGNSLTFIEQNVQNGYHIYVCVTAALKMEYNVTGVLMVSDDVLLNTWNIYDLPKEKAWLHQAYKVNRDQNHNWFNWNQKWGQEAVQSAWRNISELADSSPSIRKNFENFNIRLQMLTQSPKGLCFGFQDIFYIPRRIFKDFIFYGDIFEKHNVFLEIAIPTIIMGSLERKDVVMINGSYLWDYDRVNYQNFFNVDHVFLHPFKFGIELKKPESLTFLCNKFFPLFS